MKSSTPRERRAWQDHFRRFPFGDFYAQSLLARLCALVASMGTGKAVSPSEYAPWIDWSRDPEEADRMQDAVEYAALAAIMEARDG